MASPPNQAILTWNLLFRFFCNFNWYFISLRGRWGTHKEYHHKFRPVLIHYTYIYCIRKACKNWHTHRIRYGKRHPTVVQNHGQHHQQQLHWLQTRKLWKLKNNILYTVWYTPSNTKKCICLTHCVCFLKHAP